MGALRFTESERKAFPKPGSTSDIGWAVRRKRLDAFNALAFSIMERAVLAGDLTDDVIRRTERRILAGLREMPESLAEMTLYTDEITIGVSGTNTRRGWPWRRYTAHKHITAHYTFNPYGGSLSVWTDPKEPSGVVRFH